MVPLRQRDRKVLEGVARRRALGGSGLQPSDLEEISNELLEGLREAIRRVGGRAFAKTAEKSAKNDTRLRAHEKAESILEELTSSQDVWKQSLGNPGRGQYLVMQPWEDSISKANEFRVIIKGRRVVCITQQCWFGSYGHTSASASSAAEVLIRFWYGELQQQCP